MGKRNLFERNIKHLTRQEHLSDALRDWSVQSLIHAERRKDYQTCELCSAPFGIGGIVRHYRLAPAIAVGGMCLGTILRARFDAVTVRSRATATATAIDSRYRKLVDLGDWLTWLERNATPVLVPILADLRHLKMVASDDQLLALIRFHDERRMYSIQSLLPDWRSIEGSSEGTARFQQRMTLNQVRDQLLRLPPEEYGKIVAGRPFLIAVVPTLTLSSRSEVTLPSDAYIG